MNEANCSNSIHHRMPMSLLRAFVFVLYPLTMAGMVMVIVDKFGKGMWNTGGFGIPNIVSQVCALLSLGILAYGMYSGWKVLRSRK